LNTAKWPGHRKDEVASLGIEWGKAPQIPGAALVAIQTPTGNPFPVAIFPFINRYDASKGGISSFGSEGDLEAISGSDKAVGAIGNDEAITMFAFVIEALIQSDLQLIPS
jgi:hypothetical protein